MDYIQYGGLYPTFEVQNKILENIKENNFVSLEIVGETLCGRKINGVKIGNIDNSVLLVGAFHGMEWLTIHILLKFLTRVCCLIKKDEDFLGISFRDAFKKLGVYIVPCLNIDGVEIALSGSNSAEKYSPLINNLIDNPEFWQANARGVDINHNFPSGWYELHELEIKSGIVGPASTRYGGTHASSEPETQAIINLCKKYNFRSAYAFHSQGEEIFWHYGDNMPKQSLKIARALAITSGYMLSSPEGLAVGGGFKDWFIKEFNKPGFTIEIGLGKNPLPLSDLNNIYKKIENMLFLSIAL